MVYMYISKCTFSYLTYIYMYIVDYCMIIVECTSCLIYISQISIFSLMFWVAFVFVFNFLLLKLTVIPQPV